MRIFALSAPYLAGGERERGLPFALAPLAGRGTGSPRSDGRVRGSFRG
jgi:hypothetical protein